ncbi:phosphate acetyl/butyryltransferase [Listeria floridensis FSL S10-1187]|uniref:Phosphate acetyl/butyryltransferase n=1 Tax=Listeria floridensis FSL S10-1187 TaxID=1265817 RepID=A0ABN0RF76_9LIST|nr:phosphate acyltransferase [Listeria floridensis]EUJ31798.1 phosphate acetyl/butyryltransferase [Listeria floridensis FSL S10-1187]
MEGKSLLETNIAVKRTYAVAGANDPVIKETVDLALQKGLGNFLLFGPGEVVYDENQVKVFEASSDEDAAGQAVRAVREGKADVLVKGFVATATILRAVLAKEEGLRTDKLLSQIAMFEVPSYHKPIFITDCAMNIAPSLEEKKQITANAVEAVRKFGVKSPKVVFLSAVEKVTAKMPSTVDAEALLKFMEEEYSELDAAGPLALDVAVSKEAALHKGIDNPAAGDADILVVPNIETGNALYKALVYFGGAKVASSVIGAKAPIVISSRSDSAENKLMSFLLTGRMV